MTCIVSHFYQIEGERVQSSEYNEVSQKLVVKIVIILQFVTAQKMKFSINPIKLGEGVIFSRGKFKFKSCFKTACGINLKLYDFS